MVFFSLGATKRRGPSSGTQVGVRRGRGYTGRAPGTPGRGAVPAAAAPARQPLPRRSPAPREGSRLRRSAAPVTGRLPAPRPFPAAGCRDTGAPEGLPRYPGRLPAPRTEPRCGGPPRQPVAPKLPEASPHGNGCLFRWRKVPGELSGGRGDSSDPVPQGAKTSQDGFLGAEEKNLKIGADFCSPHLTRAFTL